MSRFTKGVAVIGLAAAMFLPLVAAAAVPASSDGVSSVQIAATNQGSLNSIKSNFNQTGTAAGLASTRNLPEIVGGIINSFLALLGIVLVIIVIYAGYKWMMSQGNADEVGKAKMMITQAVIGMVILLAAYAITGFVINAVMTGTGVQ